MTIEADEIERIIPHRYPFLLIDRVIEIEAGKSAIAIKNVTANEWCFEGHFPGRTVMPGVLIVEAMAQTGAIAVLVEEANRGKIAFFAGIDDCRFKRIVEPGDVLRLECEFTRIRGPIAKGEGRAFVGDELAAQAILTVFVGE